MFGIKDYEPDFFTTAEEGIRRHTTLLKGLLGQELLSSLAMWNVDENRLFTGGPMILTFENNNIELLMTEFEKYSITSGRIDLDTPLDWYGTQITLSWKKNALSELVSVLNKKLKSVYFVDSRMRTKVVANRENPELVGETHISSWFMNSLEFEF